MKVNAPLTTSNITTLDDLVRYSSQAITALVDAVNGKISATDNLQASLQTVAFPSATTLTVNHGLGVMPIGYVIISKSTTAQVWDGSGGLTPSTVSLQSDGAVTVKILVLA